MRIPEQLQRCVCFITTYRAGVPTGTGTGFLVAKEIGLEHHGFVYVVTAAHCLFDDVGAPDEIAIRLNTRAGASDEFMVNRDLWITHPDSDVAILPYFPDTTTFEFSAYNADSTAPKEFRDERKIGPGDDTFTTGLLVYHPGETRIMPVMRVGSIAAIPGDPVRLRIGKYPGAMEVDEHVILTEVRSIGGVSGSPVFLHLPFWRDGRKGGVIGWDKDTTAASGGESRLLGVMHGFYPVGQNDPEGVSRGNKDLNTGIAVVVPFDRVNELIDDHTQIAMREVMRQTLEKEQIPSPGSFALGSADEEEDSIQKTSALIREALGLSKDDIEQS
jgi:hypothetical protein